VEVTEVGQRLGVVRRALGVRDRLRVAIIAESVEDDQLRDRALRALDRDLRAAQHVAAGARDRTGEREAGVDATHDRAGIYTGAARAPIA